MNSSTGRQKSAFDNRKRDTNPYDLENNLLYPDTGLASEQIVKNKSLIIRKPTAILINADLDYEKPSSPDGNNISH